MSEGPLKLHPNQPNYKSSNGDPAWINTARSPCQIQKSSPSYFSLFLPVQIHTLILSSVSRETRASLSNRTHW